MTSHRVPSAVAPLRAVFLGVIACGFAACSAIPDPVIPHERRIEIGTSVQGRSIEAVLRGHGQEIIMILASIHGSEPAGTPLVEELFDKLDDEPSLLDGKTLVVVPVVNPDGFAVGKRHNDRGVDLNRNFPAANREVAERYGTEGLSEPESRAIYELLGRYPPTRIVSIHQPVACVDYDGPAQRLAAAMADVCPLPVRRLGSRPGSLGSYAGVDLRIPIITFELKRGDEKLERRTLWDLYGAALIAFIQFEG